MSIEINDQLPPFSVAATSNKIITNKDLENKYSVIYFYPKDSTPGCTTEGLDFTALHPEFSKLNSLMIPNNSFSIMIYNYRRTIS